MKNRGLLFAAVLVTSVLAAHAEQATFKGVTLLSRSTNPQRAAGLAAPAVVGQSRSTNPEVEAQPGGANLQIVLTLDSKKKTLTSTQPGAAPLSIPYARISGAEYDANHQQALTIHFAGADGSEQQLQIGLPAAQAEQIISKFQAQSGLTVSRK